MASLIVGLKRKCQRCIHQHLYVTQIDRKNLQQFTVINILFVISLFPSNRITTKDISSGNCPCFVVWIERRNLSQCTITNVIAAPDLCGNYEWDEL